VTLLKENTPIKNRRIFMFKFKKFVSCILVVVMVLAMGTTAFASEPSNVVYIDASMFSTNEELTAAVLEAQDGVNTVIVSWEDDATATIKPVLEPEIEPYFNLKNKTYSLTKSWFSLGTDFPVVQTHLKITNKTGNPGAIDICLRHPDNLDPGEKYYWGLKAGYYTEFDLWSATTTALWVKASSVSGSYTLSAVCSF